jgi:hypothetical protein
VASFDGVIPPGKVGKVTAQVNTEHYRGVLDKTVTVTSSDPTKSSVLLHIKVNVVGSAEILPRDHIGFPTYPTWDYATKILIRKDKTETGELNLTNLRSSAPFLVVTPRKVEKAEPEADGFPAASPGDYVLDIRVADDAPVIGLTSQQITFNTGLQREPSLTIFVTIQMKQALQVVPNSVVMKMPPGNHETTTQVKVKLRPGLAQEKVAATATPPAFSVTLKPSGERAYDALIAWKDNPQEVQRHGTIVFTLAGDTVSVPVNVMEDFSSLRAPPQSAPQPSTASAPAGGASPPGSPNH